MLPANVSSLLLYFFSLLGIPKVDIKLNFLKLKNLFQHFKNGKNLRINTVVSFNPDQSTKKNARNVTLIILCKSYHGL